MDTEKLQKILEAILLTAEKPLSIDQLINYFQPADQVNKPALRACIKQLQADCIDRGFELKEVSSGFRFQTRPEYRQWVSHHWTEKPPRYSRALLETLALIVYRQPITRAEIEEIRGVAVSSNIVKTLMEREWIRIVGHKEVPGRPAMFGSTRQFLDYFNLKSLDEMPPLAEIKDLDKIYPELNLQELSDSDDNSTPEGNGENGNAENDNAEEGNGHKGNKQEMNT
jgi:segregation and condensation protein B